MSGLGSGFTRDGWPGRPTRRGRRRNSNDDQAVGQPGGWSRQVFDGFGILTGLSLNDTITITVSTSKGAAGAGGSRSGQASGSDARPERPVRSSQRLL